MVDESQHETIMLIKNGYAYFKVFIAPASGPRAAVTMGMNRYLIELAEQDSGPDPRWLIGGSTGALRFVALISSILTGEAKDHDLVDHYCTMYYKPGDKPSTLAPMMEELYHKVAPKAIVPQILEYKPLRLGIFVAKLREPYDQWSDSSLKILFLWTMAKYLFSPNALDQIFQRYLFYSGDVAPDLFDHANGDIEYVRLTTTNFHQVLHATSCVPFVQERCELIDGVGKGYFIDAALTDYMINVMLNDMSPGLLLSDYPDTMTKQTIFDLFLPWRTTPQRYFENCSIVSPTEYFRELLPEKSMPTVSDWFDKRYIAEPAKRVENWKSAFQLSLTYWPKSVISVEKESTTPSPDKIVKSKKVS